MTADQWIHSLTGRRGLRPETEPSSPADEVIEEVAVAEAVAVAE